MSLYIFLPEEVKNIFLSAVKIVPSIDRKVFTRLLTINHDAEMLFGKDRSLSDKEKEELLEEFAQVEVKANLSVSEVLSEMRSLVCNSESRRGQTTLGSHDEKLIREAVAQIIYHGFVEHQREELRNYLYISRLEDCEGQKVFKINSTGLDVEIKTLSPAINKLMIDLRLGHTLEGDEEEIVKAIQDAWLFAAFHMEQAAMDFCIRSVSESLR